MQVAFQKYVSGLLDLLVIGPKDNIINHHKKPELLFLGPDENTADLMEWAARYAQSRSYPYWLSFTTGKPPTLGGVPHDTYGMTTNSVHAYVVKVLEKLGLDESNVTKFQTGGPDGDLGSNEILISKDKVPLPRATSIVLISYRRSLLSMALVSFMTRPASTAPNLCVWLRSAG